MVLMTLLTPLEHDATRTPPLPPPEAEEGDATNQERGAQDLDQEPPGRPGSAKGAVHTGSATLATYSYR